MVKLETYGDAIVYTLRTRAVRSAILIDDSFPTFHDLLENHFHEDELTHKYPDWETAKNLYAFLHGRQIVCDIENNVSDISIGSIEKIRKSDLVVLDWNLSRGDDSNSEGAVRVLKGLSESSHFNLVVVYTRTPKLADAWTRAALRLRGGWRRHEQFLKSLDTQVDAAEVFQNLDEDELTEQVTDELLARYVVGGWRSLSSADTESLLSIMKDFQVEKQHRGAFAEAFIHRVAMKRHHMKPDSDAARRLDGDPSCECPYLACGSVFVVFMNKAHKQDTKAPTIFDCLDSALKAWHPNLLQLLVSELQNEMERSSYAFDGALFPGESLKAGWLYHTLHAYAAAGSQPEALNAVVSALNSRLIEALDAAIAAATMDSNSDLGAFGRQAALLALGDPLPQPTEEDMVEKACQLARIKKSDGNSILHALNEYLSADSFRGGHITTGTVLCTEDMDQWFLCVSPACDMVPRESSDEMSWHSDLYPLRPMNLLKLEKCSPKSALGEADRGVQIFVTTNDKLIYLRAVQYETRLPRPITYFLGTGPASLSADPKPWKIHAQQVFRMRKGNSGPISEETTLFAVSQLRPAYAARFLHLTGTHQSRVGVDYIKFGSKKESACKDKV